MAVGRKTGSDPAVFELKSPRAPNLWKRSWCRLGREFRRHEKLPFSNRLDTWCHDLAEPIRRWRVRRGHEDFDFPGARELLALRPKAPSIVQCHNLHGKYFDLRTIAALSRQVPTLLTLHDAWLLSGHCAHSLGCDRWRDGCGHCPDLTIYPAVRRDATAFNWKRKQAIYTGGRFYVATPSEWLMRKVEQSMLMPSIKERRVIPNGIELSVFCPGDKEAARAELCLSRQARILLFVAKGMRSNPFKDYRLLEAVITTLAEEQLDTVVIAVGDNAPNYRVGNTEVRFVPLGQDAAAMTRYYRAADIYVHPAKTDTFPNAILEAMACGTPVIATSVGGIPEQLRHECTGFLVPAGDANVMAATVQAALKEPILLKRMGEQAAEEARERFGLQRMANMYLDWYKEILDAWNLPTQP